MESEAKAVQLAQATAALEEFIKILVKEYPMIFKDGSCSLMIEPSIQYLLFPYEASLEIRRRE